jgi:hypothetical protein
VHCGAGGCQTGAPAAATLDKAEALAATVGGTIWLWHSVAALEKKWTRRWMLCLVPVTSQLFNKEIKRVSKIPNLRTNKIFLSSYSSLHIDHLVNYLSVHFAKMLACVFTLTLKP